MIAIIKQESKDAHPLARFVTVEAVALLLNIEATRIKEIRLWNHMILVVAQGLSRFVSYADIPPILGVEPPKEAEMVTWRKRWRKLKQKNAPDFWQEFYTQKFAQSSSKEELRNWGKLIAVIKFAFTEAAIQALRSSYVEKRAVGCRV
jgi:type II secretory pathway component PulJ